MALHRLQVLSTPPSLAHQSDLALNLQVKNQSNGNLVTLRPPLQSGANGAANRYSVSGMVGLGSPAQGGRGPILPVSPYSPRVTNVADNSWVREVPRTLPPLLRGAACSDCTPESLAN